MSARPGGAATTKRTKLPQPPRPKAEFATSSKLAGAGVALIGGSVVPGAGKGTAATEEKRPSPRREGTDELQDAASRSPRGRVARVRQPETSPLPRREGSPSGESSRSQAVPSTQPTPRSGRGNSQPPGKRRTPSVPDPRDGHGLAREGEAFLKHLSNLTTANTDLQQQVDESVEEVKRLEEVALEQQRQIREFEQRADDVRREAQAAAEARMREEVVAARQDAEARSESLAARLRSVELSREAAVAQVTELEERLEACGERAFSTKQKAFDMELQLVRGRLDRESEARRQAETREKVARDRLDDLERQVEHSRREVKRAQRSAAEHQERALFQREVASDLESQMRAQEVESAQKLRRERGKLEAVSRLEGVLPRNLLLKALS